MITGMIGLAHPWIAVLALPWLLLSLALWRWQATALSWIESHVAPRFRPALTISSRRGLAAHSALLALSGLALIAAAAGPRYLGETTTKIERGRILLLLDGSASMAATDATRLDDAGEPPKNRFAAGQRIASELVKRLDGYSFALAIFSGVSTVQLPMTADRSLVDEALRVAELHDHYHSSGSSFTTALDSALHFLTAPTEGTQGAGLQVVVLSDGESPYAEDFAAPLAALSEAGVPIHCVAIGSSEGQARIIYDFRDVVAKKETKRVLQKFTTQRVDHHLQRMARQSGGLFALGNTGVVAQLAEEIEQLHQRAAALPSPAGAKSYRDLSLWPLWLFVIIFLIDRLWLPRGRRGTFRVAWDWLEKPPGQRPPARQTASTTLLIAGVLLSGSLVTCTDSPTQRAHRQNELGIASDAAGDREAARRHYERSYAYRVKPEIPTHNLARSVSLTGDFSAAHRLFQRAIKLAPTLIEAHYGDGITLFEWGEAQRDPRGCELERTLELFQAAQRRFHHSAKQPPDGPLQSDARANLEFVTARIAEIEALIANPPEECTPPQTGGGGGGGGSGGGNSSGGQGQQGQDPSGGAQTGDDAQGGDAQSRGGPLSDGERQQIARALARIEEQRQAEGKYHRRTLPEQFAKKSWENPEAKIWW